MSITQLVETL